MLVLTPVPPGLQILLVLLVSFAAFHDLRRRRIPNLLVFPATLIGFVSQFFLSGGSGLRSAGLGFGVGFLLYFPLWLLHARGAGDVKLLAAAGTFLGPVNTFALFILAAITGGILALILVLAKNRSRETAWNIAAILRDLLLLRRPARTLADPRALRLPHAPVIALSTLCILASVNIHSKVSIL